MMTESSPPKTETKPHFTLLATSFAGGPRPRNAALILGGLWLLLFFAALFAPPVLDDADATHAQAARAMATTGDLVTLHVDGVRYLEKAPLPYWLVALSFRLFGFNTFAAHLPQALAVLLLALLGHRWANQAFGARTGFYTAVAILTSVGVFLFTRILIPEVLLSLLLGAALFSFFRAMNPGATQAAARPYSRAEVREGEARERPSVISYAGPVYPYLMWGSLALAVLSKGLVALVLFGLPVLLYLWLTASFSEWRRLRPASGFLLFLAIAAPWHVLAGLRNTGGADGHGFFWFYFWNEHVLRFLGRRTPNDYNRLPGYVFWLQHLVWLFPWALFLPLGVIAVQRRTYHQSVVLAGTLPKPGPGAAFVALLVPTIIVIIFHARLGLTDGGANAVLLGALLIAFTVEVLLRRRRVGLPGSPFHRIDPQQRSILLLSLFALVVLSFFSLSTNQEYYTFPAYLPILLLIAATITRAEQTYSTSPESRRWITFAHASLAVVGLAVALALAAGLWSARHLPFNPDVGAAMAHRGVGSYTLSMSHAFDLTGASFAAVRFPAVLAAMVFLLGPAVAWMLRAQRRHIAATTAIALTGAGFLFAAQLAFVRFAPLLSSRDFARAIQRMDRAGAGSRQVLLFGDQAYGSTIPFYLGEQVGLVDARSSSMLFGSTFPDVPPVFVTSAQLAAGWGNGVRKVLFIPQERVDEAARLLAGKPQFSLLEEGGKRLITDRPPASPEQMPGRTTP